MDEDFIVRNLDDNTQYNIHMAESKYEPDYDQLENKPGQPDQLYQEDKLTDGE